MKKTSEIYKNVYHYTDWQGLNGILNSQTLWATNYQHLNDKKEIKLFMEEHLPEYLKPYLEQEYLRILYADEKARNNFFKNKGDLSAAVEHDTLAAIKAFFNPSENEIYICSLCGETNNPKIDDHGLLSQWRGYGGDGGFCIGFDTKKLENNLYEETRRSAYFYTSISDIIYSDDEKKFQEELQESLKRLADYIPAFTSSLYKKRAIKNFEFPFEEFMSCITRFKHWGFKEENEVRIVALLTPTWIENELKPRKTIHKRADKPYIELFSAIEDNLPITKIIVGPHKDKMERAQLLENKLKGKGIKIQVSEIPYVG